METNKQIGVGTNGNKYPIGHATLTRDHVSALYEESGGYNATYGTPNKAVIGVFHPDTPIAVSDYKKALEEAREMTINAASNMTRDEEKVEAVKKIIDEAIKEAYIPKEGRSLSPEVIEFNFNLIKDKETARFVDGILSSYFLYTLATGISDAVKEYLFGKGRDKLLRE
ncbi:MAG: hypothetical protein ACP5SJ_01185 [Candidatus Micrarchaeia archaeon]